MLFLVLMLSIAKLLLLIVLPWDHSAIWNSQMKDLHDIILYVRLQFYKQRIWNSSYENLNLIILGLTRVTYSDRDFINIFFHNKTSCFVVFFLF